MKRYSNSNCGHSANLARDWALPLRRPRRATQRRLFLEPLEARRVLALTVESLTPTESGFVAEFSEDLKADAINLYDAANGVLGAADVTLQGAVAGPVKGSLVVQGDRLTFIKTGGVLAPDRYTVTLRSASNGLTDQALGQLLDGEFNGTFPSGNGTAGGNFVFEFDVNASPAKILSIPDFARGPTQPLHAPATGTNQALSTGLPVRLNDAAGVTSLTATITFDPELLAITAAQLGPNAPEGSQVVANFDVPGQVTVAFFSLSPLSSGPADLLRLIGTVPEAAPYGATQAVSISFAELNAGELAVRADQAVHVVAFPGDVNANRRYDAEDARLIARVGLDLDSGFVTRQPTSSPPAAVTTRIFPYVDPVIIGDVTGVDGLSPLDASDVLRAVVGLAAPNLPVLPDAQGPTALSLSALSIAEKQPSGTVVGTFATSDPDQGDTHTYSLVAGTGSADNSQFAINGNNLVTTAQFDFATKSSYQIRVRTTDSTNRSLERTFTISVTDVNEAPTSIALSNNTVAEDAAVGSTVGVLSASDPDTGNTHTFTLVNGTGATDNGLFTIAGNELRVAATLDFETKATYSVRVRVTDQGNLSTEQTFTVQVTNVNESPTAITTSSQAVLEGQPTGTVIGTLASADPDAGDTHTYSLVAGQGDSDNASFTIVGNELRTAAVFDHGTKSSYSIRIRSTDAGGLSHEQTMVITVAETNAAPQNLSLSASSVNENVAAGSVIGTLGAVDPDGDQLTFTLVDGDGDDHNDAFVVVGGELRTAAAIDFETQPQYSIRVRATDPLGLSVEQTFTITVTDVNEAPTAISLSDTTVAEDQIAGSVVGLLSSTDQDAGDTHTYQLVEGDGDDHNAAFTIENNELRLAGTLDFEQQSSYSVRIRTVDVAGLNFEQVLSISVINVNEAPETIALDHSSVPEGQPAGTVVGTLAATDPDMGDVHVYTLVAGDGDSDNDSFTIDGNQLKTAAEFNQAEQSSYSVRIRATDSGGLAVEQIVTISVTEANAAPTALELSNSTIAENLSTGTVIGLFSASDPNASDTHAFTLVDGEGDDHNSAFLIVGGELRTAAAVDFETQSQYSIRVRATDPLGLSVEQTFTITVTDVNEAPTAISLSDTAIAEDQPAGSVVGLLTSTDQDAGDTHTYQLVEGDGDDHNAAFTIDNNELRLAETLDFEQQSSYSVRVRSIDADGLSFEQVLSISVVDVNEAPQAFALDHSSVPEGQPAGTVVGTFTATDPDTGDAHVYTLVAGDGDSDNDSFTIEGSQLKTAAEFNQAEQSSYSIRVRATDSGGLAVEQIVTVSVVEANAAPTAVELSNSTTSENLPAGTVIGVFTATDPNASDTHDFTLVAGDGDDDNDSFFMVDNELRTAVEFDFETQSSLSIRVRATDSSGEWIEEVLSITVMNVNEAPTSLAVSNSTIAENEAIDAVLGTLSTIDPDSGDSHTYSLVAGEGDADNGAFTILDNQLRTLETFDFEQQSSYSIRVRTVDAGGLEIEQVLEIAIADVNEAPTAIAVSNATVAEGEPIGTIVGTLTTADPDAGDTHTYALVAGEGDDGNEFFSIEANQLKTADVFDHASQATYSLRVRSTDAAGLMTEQILTITVAEANSAPIDLSLSSLEVDENAAVGTMVGTFSTADEDASDTHTYSLVAGDGDEGNAAFVIVGDELHTAESFDYETQAAYSIRVRVTDEAGAFFEKIFVIVINDLGD